MKGGFAQSPLRLNHSLAKLEHWNQDEIEKRAQALADIAIKAWPVPTSSAKPIRETPIGKYPSSTSGYTLNSYVPLQGPIRKLFESLRGRILRLDPTVREECKKFYIAYKTSTNFVDVYPQVKSLRLFLNMKFSEIHDPKGLCRDVSAVGHHGNGEIEVSISSPSQLEDVMYLIRQSFEKHWEEDV